jgi:hypothetical protein
LANGFDWFLILLSKSNAMPLQLFCHIASAGKSFSGNLGWGKPFFAVFLMQERRVTPFWNTDKLKRIDYL